MSDDEDKSNTSHEEEDDEDEEQSSEGSKSDEDEDKEDDEEEDDDDDDDKSGSGSEKDEDDEDDSEKQSDQDSDEESSTKRKKSKKKDTNKEADIIPKELQQKDESSLNELQKIMTEVSSLQLEVDSFLSTFSYETQQRLGYTQKSQQQTLQQGAYVQFGNTNSSNQNQIYMNSRNINLQKPVSPPHSAYNTYGNYRFQKEIIQKENNQQQLGYLSQQSYNNQQQNKINLAAVQQVDQKQFQQDQLIQTQQSPIPRRGSLEEIAEMQALLAKQQNKQIEQIQQNQQSKNQLPYQQSDQKSSYPNKYSDTGRSYQQHPEYKHEDNFGAKQSDRFRLNKESQSIIDNYYQNLYRKQVPHNRNYSNIEDLYKQKPKHIYDEDDLKKRSISPSASSKDQKFMRNAVSQQNLVQQGYQHNDQKIDTAIKVLLGKK